VRRLAREHGINLADLAGKGTGVEGRITRTDILNYIEQRKAAPASDVERVPMSPMRKAIAEHMVMSRRTSAHVTTFFEVDCSSVLASREKLKVELEKSGAKLTITPFFVLAAIRALKRFPVLNASVEGDTIVYKKTINVGIAVNIEGGLIVPVIRNAGEMNLEQISQAINDLGERARTKKLTPDDVKGGTFSVTNPGQFGAVIGAPIINQPQAAILCMGGIKKRAVVVDDDAIAVRPIIMLSLSFDHRIIDGAVADQFMADIQKQLESWQE
jgi:2-oxoglutarate dehydrogenase E2 component (dihydrolipoamide succinyltransferase)